MILRYEFADDEYDPETAEQIAQAQKDEGKARAEAEKEILLAQQQENKRESSLTGKVATS